jgi:hypothetical protein
MAKPGKYKIIALLLLFLSPALASGKGIISIGSGEPGLKVDVFKPDAPVLYRDQPETVGEGTRGGTCERKIDVIFDKTSRFSCYSSQVAEQLYPFDGKSAFTSETEYLPPFNAPVLKSRRKLTLYRLINGKLQIGNDVQSEASRLYGLERNDLFLGYIDGRIFYWHTDVPSLVYWRNNGKPEIHSIKLPRGVTEVYGVTKGIKKDVGFVVLRYPPRFSFSVSPMTSDFLEFSLRKS